MPSRKKTPTTGGLNKGHWVALGLSLALLNVSPYGREFWGKLFGRSGGAGRAAVSGQSGTAAAQERLDFGALTNDLAAFNEWFLSDAQAPVAEIRIVRQEEIAAFVSEPGDAVRQLWAVPIGGTVKTDSGWAAVMGPNILTRGTIILPSETLCGYQVLSVSRQCIWLVAFFDQPPEDELPTLSWPNIEGIRTMPGRRGPDRVELRRGVFVRRNDDIAFAGGARMKVGRLWPTAVHLRYYVPGESAKLDLLCVVMP